MDTNNIDFQSMMTSFMQNAQKVQENLKGAYQEISERNKDRTVFGQAGGDLVKVEISLKLQVKNMEFDPKLFNEAPEVVRELIVAATNQAIARAQDMLRTEMSEVAKKVGLPKDMPLPFGG